MLIELEDRSVVQPMAMAVTMLSSCPAPLGITASTFDGLAGTDQLRLALQAGRPAAEIVATWQPDLARFNDVRARYLLY